MTTPSRAFLQQISTNWPLVNNPVQFIMRYAPAIQRYMAAIVRDPHEAEDACHDFLARVFQRGFEENAVHRGRFRDYLKAAVRNAALTHLRRQRNAVREHLDLNEVAGPATPSQPFAEADALWTAQWRQVVLERAWQALELAENEAPDSLVHTSLRLAAENPEATSAELADRVSRKLGRPYRAEAFRKQLSRARRLFAQLLVDEVKQTLKTPAPERVEEELIDLDLLKYVRDYLPRGAE